MVSAVSKVPSVLSMPSSHLPVEAAESKLAPTPPTCSSTTTATSSASRLPKASIVHKGLEGVVVSETTVSTVGVQDVGLTYRGYPVTQLIAGSCFEETALLLIIGELPTSTRLNDFREKIAASRILKPGMKAICETFDADAHPMDVIRTVISAGPCVRPCDEALLVEGTASEDLLAVVLGIVPSAIGYWYNFARRGRRIDTVMDAHATVAEHFLTMLDKADGGPSALAIGCLDKTLIAYAEHDLNASTFAGRVTASTCADYYSCVVSAIGTLKGPLHGGANVAALEMLESIPSESDVSSTIGGMLERKEKIMGFGHRVYKNGDPRHIIMKQLAKRLSEAGDVPHADPALFSTCCAVERVMIDRKGIHPNLDLCASLVYKQLGIPKSLFTVLFAVGRFSGWTAHIEEQRIENKLIRPKSKYVGHSPRDYMSINA